MYPNNILWKYVLSGKLEVMNGFVNAAATEDVDVDLVREFHTNEALQWNKFFNAI